mgnify:CR=1 FL=1
MIRVALFGDSYTHGSQVAYDRSWGYLLEQKLRARGTNVEVHLPMNLVLTVLRNVDVENFHGGHVDFELDDMDVNWPEIMKAVKDAPDGKFVTVTSDEADVNVHKQAGTLYINVNQKDDEMAKVEVTMPMEMMDALSFGEENTLDIAPGVGVEANQPDEDSDATRVGWWI